MSNPGDHWPPFQPLPQFVYSTTPAPNRMTLGDYAALITAAQQVREYLPDLHDKEALREHFNKAEWSELEKWIEPLRSLLYFVNDKLATCEVQNP